MKILVVEDDRVSRTYVAETLIQAGFHVTAAKNGKEALKLFLDGNFSMVLSDWQMPKMDGVELCKEIRALTDRSYVYFILLTSCTDQSDVVLGLEAGADDYVKKPYDASELILRTRIGERTLRLETKDMTIFTLSKLVEMRSQETSMHLWRVRAYSELLARQLQRNGTFPEIDSRFIELIRKTSWLHDIGKIAIPDCVLLKPGSLTESERKLMQSHALVGASAFEAAIERFYPAPFLVMASQIAKFHHERFDGSGYPEGRIGDGIPLAARIVALCDAYDAMSMQRVYKAAMSHDIVRAEIVAESGCHFDPLVVDAFVEIEHLFAEVAEMYLDGSSEEDQLPPGHSVEGFELWRGENNLLEYENG